MAARSRHRRRQVCAGKSECSGQLAPRFLDAVQAVGRLALRSGQGRHRQDSSVAGALRQASRGAAGQGQASRGDRQGVVLNMRPSLFCPDAFLSPLAVDAAVTRALEEDLGRAGDVTSIATIPEGAPARAVVVARAGGVIAGLPLVAATFQKLAGEIETSATHCDGAAVAPGTTLMRISGP